MLDDVSFDDSNDKLMWGSIFTGIGFSLGFSCFLVRCVCQACRKKKRRRPVDKVLGRTSSNDDTSSSGVEMTPEPASDSATDDETDESEVAVDIPADAEAPPSGAGKLYLGKGR